MAAVEKLEISPGLLNLPEGFSADSPPEVAKLWKKSQDSLITEAVASGAILTTADRMIIERLAYTYAYMKSIEWHPEKSYTVHELKTLNKSFLDLAREFLKLIGRDDDERQAHQRKLFVEAVFAAVNESGIDNADRIRVMRALQERFE